MDQSNLAAIWAAAWPYVTGIIAAASALDAALPQPAPGSHWLIARKVVSFLAVNVGNASNGKQPDFVTWIVRIAAPVLAAQNGGTTGNTNAPAASGGGATTAALLVVASLGLGLAACADKPPATVLFETRAAYDASVLAPLVQYHQLPACPAATGVVCKDPDIDAQLIKADAAASQAGIAADQMLAARQAADAARASVADAAAVVANADAGLRALVADAQSGVDSGKAAILSVGSAAEDRIATAAAGFESEVQALANSAAGRIDAAVAHIARFVIPIEQVARAALDAEHRRLRDARDDLLRFSTLIQS